MNSLQTLATGFAASAALIVAIGAQNAFVLRQGLSGGHVGAVVAFCAGADALLIGAGVWGLGRLLVAWPGLETALTLAGALFLAAYAAQALWRLRAAGALAAARGPVAGGRRRVLLQAAAFTLLNPHVYLDTVLLLGALGAPLPGPLRLWFVAGGTAASALWFTALGYGARRLAPWFARPGAWRVLDAVVALTMGALALGLLRRLAG